MHTITTGHVVDDEGRHDGRTLQEWLPDVIEDIVRHFDPLVIILFGSLIRGETHRDSDIDLLVVVPAVTDGPYRRRLMGKIRRAIRAPVAVDIFVTCPEEIAQLRNVLGSFLYWPLREGKIVHERAA